MYQSNLKYPHDIGKVVGIIVTIAVITVMIVLFKPKTRIIEDKLFVVTQKEVITSDRSGNPYFKYLTVVNYMGKPYEITEYRIFEMLEPFYHQSVTCKFKITRFFGYEWIKVLGVTE